MGWGFDFWGPGRDRDPEIRTGIPGFGDGDGDIPGIIPLKSRDPGIGRNPGIGLKSRDSNVWIE